MNRASAFLIVLVSSGPVANAHAGAILLQDDRSVEVFASVVEVGNMQEYGPVSEFAALGAPFIAAIDTPELAGSNGYPMAYAAAVQSSSLISSPTFTSILATGSADGTRFGNWGPGPSNAESESSSDLSVRFSIAAFQEWTISASIAGSAFNSTAFVRLRNVGSDEFVFNLESSGETDLSDSDGGMLPPGEYEILAQALVRLRSPTKWTMSHSQFDLEFTIVPEPAAGSLLLGCSMLVIACRRSRARLAESVAA